MQVDTNRKNILISLLDWLYTEFKDDLPSIVRLPAHLVLCLAKRATRGDRKKLQSATAADVEAAITGSKLAATYAAEGLQKASAIQDAVRLLTKACQDEFDELRILSYTNLKRSDDILVVVHDIARRMRDSGVLERPFTLTPPRNIRPRNARFVGLCEPVQHRIAGSLASEESPKVGRQDCGGSGPSLLPHGCKSVGSGIRPTGMGDRVSINDWRPLAFCESHCACELALELRFLTITSANNAATTHTARPTSIFT